MTGGWLEPRCCTVIGAAHRRRGQPCQDASRTAQLTAPDGSPLQLIAVADGHGNRRHWLSAVGSQLACQAAERAVRQALAATPLAAIERWRLQLQQDLPEAIVQDWLAATAADWAHRAEAKGQPFSPLAYGSTLGLVLLAPGWWGCTGLGDWDLVRIHADGRREVVSEEAAEGADGATRAGEATASLCLPAAAGLFAERVRLETLPAAPSAGQGQALVLSSDGMRKSCLTDADFLELCGELCGVSDPDELEAGLAQITAEGSGDDVSVAMACWAARSPDPPAAPQPRPYSRQALALLLLLGGGLAAGWWWWSHPLRASAPTPASTVPTAVALEAARQCAAPERIRANLNQRRAQFEQRGPAATAPGQPTKPGAPALRTTTVDGERDPLGALIAASRIGPVPGCAQLEEELRLQWQRAEGRPPAASQPGRMPPENGRPAATPATPTRQP